VAEPEPEEPIRIRFDQQATRAPPPEQPPTHQTSGKLSAFAIPAIKRVKNDILFVTL